MASGEILTTYSNEMREEIKRYKAVQISDTEPTDENTSVWIAPNATESFKVPEVKDSEINEEDTWSSKKISDEDTCIKNKINTINNNLAKPFGYPYSITFDESKSYNNIAKGWVGAGMEKIPFDTCIKIIKCIPRLDTILVGILKLKPDNTIESFDSINTYSTPNIGTITTIKVNINVKQGDILLIKNVFFAHSDMPTYYWAADYSGDNTADNPDPGKEMTTYNLLSPIAYSNGIDYFKCNFTLDDIRSGTNDAIDSLDDYNKHYDYYSNDVYARNNIGWTGANGLSIEDYGKITSFTVYSHFKSSTAFDNKISVCKLTIDSDSKIISVDETLEFISKADNTEQTFSCNIDINKGQILLFKGIGFCTIDQAQAFSSVYFTTDELKPGIKIGTYAMEAPIRYTVTNYGKVISEIRDNKSNINLLKKNLKSLSLLKFVSFGDSITDDEISAIGSLVCARLGCYKINNFARGNGTMSDYSSDSNNTTTIDLSKQDNAAVPTNVISNQIRRMLQWTTAEGEQIKWTHPIDGDFSIDISYGVGLGHTDDIPDIIYISAGTNDTKDKYRWVDDCDTVFAQTYSELTRITIASALRWAIETLQCKYPKAQIFVLSPLQTNRGWNWGGDSYTGLRISNTWQARSIIEKTCRFCSVHFIDQYSESGFNNLIAQKVNDGIHPMGEWRTNIVEFLANEIYNKYTKRV